MMSEIVPIFEAFLSTARTVYDAWSRHKAKRTHDRIERVQVYLRTQVTRMDEQIRRLEKEPKDADLFLATLNSLIHDDEDVKTPFYAAFLAHLLTASTNRHELRRVASCLKSLSAVELDYLGRADEGGKLPRIHEDWVEVSLPARLQSLGLYVDPSRAVYKTRLTSVGLLARSIAIAGKKTLASESKSTPP